MLQSLPDASNTFDASVSDEILDKIDLSGRTDSGISPCRASQSDTCRRRLPRQRPAESQPSLVGTLVVGIAGLAAKQLLGIDVRAFGNCQVLLRTNRECGESKSRSASSLVVLGVVVPLADDELREVVAEDANAPQSDDARGGDQQADDRVRRQRGSANNSPNPAFFAVPAATARFQASGSASAGQR